jgi:hypothetical protein
MDYLGINSPSQLPQLKDINTDFVLPSNALEAQVEIPKEPILIDQNGNLNLS